jgi:hypothetical protein
VPARARPRPRRSQAEDEAITRMNSAADLTFELTRSRKRAKPAVAIRVQRRVRRRLHLAFECVCSLGLCYALNEGVGALLALCSQRQKEQLIGKHDNGKDEPLSRCTGNS